MVFKSVAPWCQAMRLGAKPSSRISKATAKELTNLDMPKSELNPLQAETETETETVFLRLALEKPCQKMTASWVAELNKKYDLKICI